MRLIDADALKEVVKADIDRCYALRIGSVGPLANFLDQIDEQPTIGIVKTEIKHTPNGGLTFTAENVTVEQENRVAELEAELAAAMEYISAAKDCETCKRYGEIPDTCPCECDKCRHEDCICRGCNDGSKWEWRGAYGTE